MRLQISKSKNAASFYITKSVYNKGKRTSKIVKKLGTYDELLKKLNGKDPYEWAKEYVEELNRLEKEGKEPVVIAEYFPSKLIERNMQHTFNGGYLFLQQIYHELKLNKLCAEISQKYKFTFDLNSILSRLLYSRIIYPSSKLATFQLSSRFIEQPDFELQHIYRALEVLAKEKSEAGIENIKTKLEESNLTGALLCDSDYFKFLFNIGKRKSLRDNSTDYMGLITINCENKNINSEEELKKIVKSMSGVLGKTLRKDDVYSYWNDTQILIMLHGAKKEYLNKIEMRIRANFNNIVCTNNYKINIEFLPLLSQKNIV